MTAAEVRRLRQAFGCTQEKFAQEMGVTFSTVSRWENGHVAPSRLAVRRMRDLAAQHGVRLEVRA